MFSAADAAAARFSRSYRLSPPDREDAFQDARAAVLEVARRGRSGTFSFWFTVATNRLRDLSHRRLSRAERELYGSTRMYGFKQVMEAVQ